MIDAVLSYHMNPQTCGVSKFNHALAKRLRVPHDHVNVASAFNHPLISVKLAELNGYRICAPETYDMFLHDWNGTGPHYIKHATRVYAGNRQIAERIMAYRPDVLGAFCPSTLHGNPSRGRYRVLVFGMAHKLNLPHFETLKAHLEREHDHYTIELSTAVHEGSPWDQALTESIEAMRGIFGDKLRVLGFLGDDALAKELREVDAVAMYYQPALRANNTTYWAAVDAGKTIYTNRDALSPQIGDPPATWDALVSLIKGAA
jgi:hypothetical protein